MVAVPTKKVASVQVGAAPVVYQSSNVPSGAFDNGASGLIKGGQQLGQASDQLANLTLKIQRDDNVAEAKAGDTSVASGIRDMLRGTADVAGSGYLNSQGKEALDSYTPTEDALGKLVQDVAGNSSNDAVKRMVTDAGTARVRRAYDQIAQHMNTERKKYHNEIIVAREAQAAVDAADAWRSPGALARSVGIMAQENTDYADLNSLPKEVAKLRLLEKQAVVVKGAFDAALANDAIDVAKRILKDHGKQIDPAIRTRMQNDLKAQNLTVTGQALAAEAITKYPSDPQAQRTYIRKKASGRAEKAGVSEVNQMESEAIRSANHAQQVKDRAKAEEVKKAQTEAVALTLAGKDVPRPLMSKLPPGSISTLNSIKNNVARTGSGYAQVTDAAAELELNNLMHKDPLGFANKSIAMYASRMTEGTMKYWRGKQDSILKNKASLGLKAPNYVLADNVAKGLLDTAGIKYGKGASKEDALRANFIITAARRMVDTQPDGAKPFTDGEIRKTLGQLFLPGRIPGSLPGLGWWGSTGPIAKFLGTSELSKITISTDGKGMPMDVPILPEIYTPVAKYINVPEKFMPQIAAELTSRGYTPTAANIKALYERAVSRDTKKGKK